MLALSKAGSIFGTIVFSYMSDRVGRRITLIAILYTYLVSAVISPILTKNLYVFMAARFVSSMITPCVFQVPFIMVIEMVGTEHRAWVNVLTALPWAIGSSFLPLLVYMTKTWVWLNVMIVVPTVGLLFLAYNENESVRWLITQERYDEAAQVLVHMAKANGKPVESKEALIEDLMKIGKSFDGDQNEKAGVKAFFTFPKLRMNFILLAFGWIGISFAFYGINLSSINMEGNKLWNFFLVSIIELPADFLFYFFIQSPLGRRWSMTINLIVTTVFMIAPAFYPVSWTYLTIIMIMGAKVKCYEESYYQHSFKFLCHP